VKGSKFVDNIAKLSASGAYLSGQPLQNIPTARALQAVSYRKVNFTIQTSNFTNNSANVGKGGVFFFNALNMDVNIEDSVFLKNHLNLKNYSLQDAAVFYLGENRMNTMNVQRSVFEMESAVKVRNVTNTSSNLPENLDIDYFGVLYARNSNMSQINIVDSTFR
jgi:hypothetical protein